MRRENVYRKILVFSIILWFGELSYSQEATYKIIENIPYSLINDEYAKERCKLDLYYPENLKGCPTVVWFHGGGLTGGSKHLPEQLKNKGMIVIAVNYRLLPKIHISDCLQDAAAAVAWAFKSVERYGGDRKKIFVSGHSAGGYLSAMLGLDKKWLDHFYLDADSIAGIIPFSGQAISHFAYRKMMGIDHLQPVIDEYAPLYHVRKDAPSFVLITGDRELELFGRYEENAYLWRMMKLVGHMQTYLVEIGGYDHGSMAEPAFYILHQHVIRILNNKR